MKIKYQKVFRNLGRKHLSNRVDYGIALEPELLNRSTINSS